MTFEETFNQLDSEQKAAIEFDDCLVIASPGSGKTRTLVAKAIKEAKKCKRVYVITFTVNAADEIQRRISESRDMTESHWNALDIRVSTLHSYCLGVLQDAGIIADLIDDPSLDQVIKEVIAKLRSVVSPKRARELMEGATPAKRGEQGLQKAVYKALEEHGLITYQMILEKAHGALSEFAMDWRKGPEVIYLVDEVQDSAPMDLEIYEKLFNFGAHLWMVGDLQQAIYSFRHHGTAINILEWWEGLTHWPLAMCTLSTNYRSGEAIVKACNKINEGFAGRIIGKADSPAPESEVQLVQTEFENQMHYLLAQRVSTLLAKDGQIPDEIAVLCRTNADVLAIMDVCQASRIPIKVRQISKPDIPVQLWAALAMYTNPTDWNVGRWMGLNGSTSFQIGLKKSEAVRALEPLVKSVQPNLSPSGGTTEDWPGAMDLLGVPMDDQVWFWNKLKGADWLSMGWDEIKLRLYEGAELKVEGHGVTVGTIHSAKGKEWEHVLMPYCDNYSYPDGHYPDGRAAEEARVFFVGASRAINSLYFFKANQRMDRWSHQAKKVDACVTLEKLIKKPLPVEA